MAGTIGAVIPLHTVPCMLAVSAALIEAISLFRAAISSFIV